MTFSRSLDRGVGMYVAALEPVYREVALRYSRAHHTEKNWMPFVHEEKLYISRNVCPHSVLHCDAESGVCRLAYETRLEGCLKSLRGGSQFIRVDNSLIGIAHTTRIPISRAELSARNMTHYCPVYKHYVVRADSTPPFALRRISSPFLLPAMFQTDADVIQFISGLAFDGQYAVLTYGLGDCAALQLTVPIDVLTL